MSFSTYEYAFNAGVVEPPTASQVRLNDALQENADLVWITHSTSPGQDTSLLFGFVDDGAQLLLQDWDDSTKYHRYLITGPRVDKGSYSEFPISAYGTQGNDLTTQKLAVSFVTPVFPAGADPGEVLTINALGEPEWIEPGVPVPGPNPVPTSGLCPWPIDAACLSAEWDAMDTEVKDRAVALSSATLRRLSGYRVGGCPVTVRPCKSGCVTSSRPAYLDMVGAYGSSGYWPHIEGGVWVNSCGCAGDCSCGPECRIALPAPVGRVDEVRVNGVAVIDWVIDGDGILWTGDTECPWPTCQDMTLDDTEPNTFSVTYLNSWPVDSLGAYAAGILAMEFAKACVGGKCRLPAGVTTIARQGVSMEIAAGSFPNGFTGLREVDAWIALWNPQPLRETTKVWYPGMPVARVTR